MALNAFVMRRALFAAEEYRSCATYGLLKRMSKARIIKLISSPLFNAEYIPALPSMSSKKEERKNKAGIRKGKHTLTWPTDPDTRNCRKYEQD